ncbi:DUF2357 domain-containing protein [Mammaliicoccus sciuri]|uniref:DUF2357 domain-containing protein n=1 Tax=Mammaliicoccus sciuri TaxID=1296 RepID=UPI001FB40422|nr:DUF2357 domain-containing protein [Mammaliicoccus sciuri]MCJ0917236.1 hypothetical protein [Mammaliicoccus sciuri]MCJ0938089.1 hypothetical protein [Mammaliicoccus sciuri]
MDSLSNLDIIVSNDYQHDIFNINFKDSINDINFEKDVLTFKEYHALKIRHESNDKNERLYFNGFDIIEDEALYIDEKGKYYLSNASIDIISYSNNKTNNILVPGYYLLTIVNHYTKYAIIKIEPKNFSEEEWKTLYQSLNEYLNGLANSLVNEINAKVIQNKSKNSLRDKINFINKYYKDIINSINQLIINPRQNIQKNYNWVYKYTQPPVDKNTFKYSSKYPNKKQYLYTYKRDINYNIPENIWVKNVIDFLFKELESVDRLVTLKIEGESHKLTSKYKNVHLGASITKSNLIQFKKNISSIRNLIIKLRNTEWFNLVTNRRYIVPPQSSLMNKNYNLLYKWYSEFNKSNLDFIFSENIMNSWKKTDELYEIWCFINIIELLKDIGFKPTKGWIFDGDIENDLDEGTYVTMTKNDITLNVHYNSQLKYKSSNTDLVHPLYTGNSKNKPDIRIDIFVNEIYLKSLPMEVKYRKLKTITHKKRDILRQLLAYRDSPKSLLHLKGAKDIRKNNHTVITKVIVLYPRDKSSKYNTDTLSFEHGLLFYEFGPNYIDNSLKDTLYDEINEAFEIYNDIYQQPYK